MRETVKKFKAEWKQRFSWVLICVIMFQTITVGQGLPAYAGGSSKIDIKDYATPSEAFDYIELWSEEDKVQADGFELNLELAFNNDFLEQEVEKALEKAGDDYINECADIDFSFRVKCEFLKENMDFKPQKIVYGGEAIGTLITENHKNYLDIRIEFNKEVIYSSENISAGGSLSLEVSEGHNGAGIQIKDNKDGSVTVKIGSGEPDDPDEKGAYSISKKASSSEADAGITYTITARASSSEAASASEPASTSKLSSRYDDIDDWDTWQAMDDDEEDVEEPGTSSQIRKRKHTKKSAGIKKAMGLEKSYSLEGKYIIDEIPSELEVIGIYAGSGDDREELTPLQDYYKDGKVVYPIASPSSAGMKSDTAGNITEAVITVETRLNDSIITGMEKWGTVRELDVENKVALRDNVAGTKDLASDKTTTHKRLEQTITKDGQEVGVDGRVIRWNIRLSTVLVAVDSAYLIDWLGDGLTYSGVIHVKDSNGGGDGEDVALSDSDISLDLGETSPDAYFNNADSMKEFMELVSEKVPSSSSEAVKFTYTYKDRETSGKETVHTSTGFILPALNLINRDLEIVYDTDVEMGGHTVTSGSGTVTNNAAFVHRHYKGEGPGEWEWPESVDLKKEVEYNHEALKKSVTNYDMATQTMSWKFEINRSKSRLDEFTLTDVFDNGKQVILENEGDLKQGKLILHKADRTALENETDYELLDGASPDYFTLIDSDNQHTLTVHLEDVEPEDYYYFTIKTRVIDPEILGNENAVLKNTASYQVKTGEQDYEGEASAVRKIKMPFISKDAVDTYDYEKNLVKWKIGYNDDNILLKDSILTDSLPEGVIFSPDGVADGQAGNGCEITGIEVKERTSSGIGDYKKVTFEKLPTEPNATPSDAEEVLRYRLNDSENHILSVLTRTNTTDRGYSKQDMIFVLYEKSTSGDGLGQMISENAFRLEFTTYVEEPYRRKEFKSNDSILLNNTVRLDSFVISSREEQGTPVKIERTADANHVAAKQITKEGQFHNYNINGGEYDGLPWLEWEVTLNKTGADFSGVTVKDEMQDYLELDPDSLQIYKTSMNPSGEITSPGQMTPLTAGELDENFTILKNGAYFDISYQENAPLANTPIVLRYHTMIVDSVPDGGVKNKVIVNWPDGRSDESESTNTDANNFRNTVFGQLSKLKMATVTKKSANSAGGGHVLEGARFNLVPVYERSSPGTENLWTPVNDATMVKSRTSNSSGQMFFVRLKNDVIYRLDETKPAQGYDLDSYETQYLLFTGGMPEKLPSDISKDALHVQDTGSGVLKMNMDVLNSPRTGADNRLEFSKQDQSGTPLDGADFLLTDPSGRLNPRRPDSYENGKVIFENLDPSMTYHLEEAAPPYGYQKAPGYLEVKVLHDGENGFKVETKAVGGFPYTADRTASPSEAVVTNTRLLTDLAFYKTDQNYHPVDGTVYPIRFHVERKEKGEADTAYAPYPGSNSDSVQIDEDGLVKLYALPCGVYRLTEDFEAVKDKLAGEQKPQVIVVYIEPDTSSYKSTEVTFYNVTEKETDAAEPVPGVLNVPSGLIMPKDAKALNVVNDFPYGYIQVNKTKALKLDGSLIMTDEPVEGAVFEVYEGVKDGTVWKPIDGSQPLLSLRTNSGGHFDREDMGKLLMAGRTYLVKEVDLPDGFYHDSTLNYPGYDGLETRGFIPVTIEKAGETYYIGAAEQGGSMPYSKDGRYAFGTAELRTDADPSLLYYNIEALTGNIRGVKYGAFYNSSGTALRKPLEGVTFRITQLPVTDTSYTGTAVTDEKGILLFEHVLAEAEGTGYRLEEVVQADGYQTPDGSSRFARDIMVKAHETAAADDNGDTLAFINEPLAFALRVNKTDSDREPLAGAQFELQVKSEDGSVTKLCTLKETAGGVHVLPDPAVDGELMNLGSPGIWDYFTYTGREDVDGALISGTERPALFYSGDFEYQIMEVNAPEGYTADGGIYTVDKKEAQGLNGGEYRISNEADGNSFVNECYKNSLLIEKRIEGEDGSILSGADGADLSGFRFLLTGKDVSGKAVEERIGEKDITGAREITIVPAEGIYLEMGAGGTIVVDNAGAGTYMIKELDSSLTAPGGAYHLDTEGKTVKIRKKETEPAGEKAVFTNRLKRGTITGRKVTAPVTENSRGLEGAVMGLFKEGTERFTAADAYLGKTALSGSDGLFRFEDVPYGTYLVAEIMPPSGYYLNETTFYRVTLSSDTENHGIELTGNPASELTEAGTDSEIVIGDRKKESGSHGGSGGGGTTPGGSGGKEPTGPGAETKPEETGTPENPTQEHEAEESTAPPAQVPPAVIPPSDQNGAPPAVIEKAPDGGIRVEIPDDRIDRVIVKNDQNEEVFHGKYDNGVTIDRTLPAGNYGLTTIDESGVPLGEYLFTIDDSGVPLASLPKMGERTAPYPALLLIMFGGILMMIYGRRKRR